MLKIENQSYNIVCAFSMDNIINSELCVSRLLKIKKDVEIICSHIDDFRETLYVFVRTLYIVRLFETK